MCEGEVHRRAEGDFGKRVWRAPIDPRLHHGRSNRDLLSALIPLRLCTLYSSFALRTPVSFNTHQFLGDRSTHWQCHLQCTLSKLNIPTTTTRAKVEHRPFWSVLKRTQRWAVSEPCVARSINHFVKYDRLELPRIFEIILVHCESRIFRNIAVRSEFWCNSACAACESKFVTIHFHMVRIFEMIYFQIYSTFNAEQAFG